MKCKICGTYSGKYELCKDCYYNSLEDNSDLEDDLPFGDNEEDELTCPICGNPTRVYMGNARKDRLCGKHADMLKAGEIVINDKGLFVDAKTKKILNKDYEEPTPTVTSNIESIIIDKTIRCITCGYETEGKLFCKKCYSKYCDKEILIKIKNCKEIIPLDDSYEGYYECDDGHVVKSMAERDIDDYLFAHNIKHGYEIPLKLTDLNGKGVTLHPDFCIFDENTKPLYYIEYWGYDDSNRDYTKTKKFKLPLYEKAGITLININAKTDLRNLKANLRYKLENYKTKIINFLDE